MTYNYKGINLTNILKSGTSITEYAGLTGTAVSVGQTKSLPYDFGYNINGQSLSNSYIAMYTDYTTPTVATVPVGATHMRIIAIGGGGSGGGNGGNARANVTVESFHEGGNGGNGSSGSYLTTNNDVLIQSSNIQITIGTGGDAGLNGANHSDNNVSGKASAQGDNGKTNPGNSTIIIYNGTTYTAPGGVGGVGGKGGDASAYDDNKTGGSDGADGASYTQVATTPTSWPNLSQYGVGGNGGLKSANGNIVYSATAGGDGAARIIWLYM